MGAGLISQIAHAYGTAPDAVSYLDLGDAWWRGHWHEALNGYWSPLYSWLLGIAVGVTRPGMWAEAPVVAGVNLIVYLTAAAAYWWLLREFRACGASQPLGEPAWTVVAWSLFIWAAYILIEPATITPDLVGAVFVFAAAGLILRIRRGVAGTPAYAAFGAMLALGALAKAPLFPLALVFAIVALLVSPPLRRALPRLALAAVVFGLIAGPYFVALSAKLGRPTMGTAAALNYAHYVDGVPRPYWEPGEASAYGRPAHPPPVLMRDPAVYLVARPGHGSIPGWYDPGWWMDGVEPRFNAVGEARALAEAWRMYRQPASAVPFAGLALAVVLLLALGRARGDALRALRGWWPLIVPAVAAFLLFIPVHVELRYAASFAPLFWLPLLSCLPIAAGGERALVLLGATLAVAGTGLWFAKLAVPDARYIGYVAASGSFRQSTEQERVTRWLDRQGLGRGTTYAYLGPPLESWESYFARLAGGQLGVDVLDDGGFWRGAPARRSLLLDRVARAGAAVVVTRHAGPAAAREGWRRIADTRYWAFVTGQTDSAALRAHAATASG